MIIIPKKKKKKEIWLTNISREKDIMLGDLALKIPRGKSMNVLDSRHHHYTEEEIRKSIENGSVYKKRRFIKVRENAPQKIRYKLDIETPRVLRKNRNAVDIEEKYFEDLDFIDNDDFVGDNADAALYDHEPALPVDKRYFQSDEPEENEED